MKLHKKEEATSINLKIIPTKVMRQPSADFIVILHQKDIEKIGTKENHYVLLQNTVGYKLFCWDDLSASDETKSHEMEKITEFFSERYKIEFKKDDIKLKNDVLEINNKKYWLIITKKSDNTISLTTNNEKLSKLNLDLFVHNEKLFVVESRILEIYAHAISSKHEESDLKDELEEGQIAVDQTYREALGLRKNDEVKVSKTNKKYGFWQKARTYLNYQKAVVRVQQNAPYMEQRTPTVCLCSEILNSINSRYGDVIIIETKGKQLSVKCAELTKQMQDVHDFLLNPPLTPNHDNDIEKRLERVYFINPNKLLTKSNRKIGESSGDMIHPIFMDSISRKLLGVKELEPVKIRRSFRWESQKKLNSFGAAALMAISVMLPPIISQVSGSDYLWFIIIPLAALVVWGIFNSSKFNASNKNSNI